MLLLGDDEDEVEAVSAKIEVITLENVRPKTKKSSDTSPGGSTNPFTSAGIGGSNFGPFGRGIGRTRGIPDMLKNMGG